MLVNESFTVCVIHAWIKSFIRDALHFERSDFATSGLCRFAKLFLAKISASFSIYPYQYIARDIGSMSIMSIFFSSSIRCSAAASDCIQELVAAALKSSAKYDQTRFAARDWHSQWLESIDDAPRHVGNPDISRNSSPFMQFLELVIVPGANCKPIIFALFNDSRFQHPQSWTQLFICCTQMASLKVIWHYCSSLWFNIFPIWIVSFITVFLKILNFKGYV